MEQSQSVIYRLDKAQRPEWQYYSLPESIVGGGNTLEAARADYLSALRFSLETDELPVVHEYVERQIGKLGVWLRMPVGQGDYEEMIRFARRQIQRDDLDWFRSYPTAGGDPVIVNADPEAPLSSVIEQMTVHDSLIIAMRYSAHGETKNLFLVLAGAQTEGTDVDPLTDFESMGLTVDTPLRELMEMAVASDLSGFSVPALC